MTGRLINWLLISLFVGWIFFILGSFFAVQKPFGAANVTAVIKALFNLLTAGWLILIGLGLGSWLLQRFFALNLSLIERVVLGSGLGLGLLGLLAFGLGLLGLFSSIVAYSVTFILTLLVAPHLRCLFRQWRKWQPVNAPHRLISLYLLLISLFAVSLALLPPSDWDGLFYHLTAPKIYLQAGGIVGGFDVPHFNFPSLMEMLFAWAMLLRGDIAAKLLHTAFGLLLTGLIYLMTRHLFGKKAAWPAVVILVSMPMLGTLAAWAYNDLALAFYQLASFYAFIRWKSGVTASRGSQPSNPTASGELQADTIQNPNSKIQNQRWLILCGLFAGLAMGLKYTSFVTPVLISGLIVWESYQLSMSNYRLSNKWGHNARFTRFFLHSGVCLTGLNYCFTLVR